MTSSSSRGLHGIIEPVASLPRTSAERTDQSTSVCGTPPSETAPRRLKPVRRQPGEGFFGLDAGDDRNVEDRSRRSADCLRVERIHGPVTAHDPAGTRGVRAADQCAGVTGSLTSTQTTTRSASARSSRVASGVRTTARTGCGVTVSATLSSTPGASSKPARPQLTARSTRFPDSGT